MLEVLLVEDNGGDALLVRQALNHNPIPVRLHIARDGEQALSMLSNPDFRPSLIILDLNIPKVPGLALLGKLEGRTTPVVVFSSTVNPDERERSLALGAREFVQKPTDLDDFQAVVLGMIEKWAAPQANGAANGE